MRAPCTSETLVPARALITGAAADAKLTRNSTGPRMIYVFEAILASYRNDTSYVIRTWRS